MLHINMFFNHIKEQLSLFYLSCYRFSYIADEEVHFSSYKGIVFRGGLGHNLKEKACLMPEVQCENCNLNSKCVYSRLFESPVPKESKYFCGQPFIPHPFIIEPPLENKDIYYPGEVVEFKLILIGSSVEYLPYFIFAFMELGNKGLGKIVNGRRGKCTLDKVESLGNADGEAYSTIYLRKKTSYSEPSVLLYLDSLMNGLTCLDAGNKYIKINFLTPTSIKFKGEITKDIDFPLLLRNTMRRISTLSYYYCGYELQLHYKDILEQASEVSIIKNNLKWVQWERHSGRQRKKFGMEGFLGEITFFGEMDNYLPLLLFGQYLHLGKGTSFGYGKYLISQT